LVSKRLTLAFGVGVWLTLAVVVPGCGSSNGTKIALLLAGSQRTRYESRIRPAFEQRIDKICRDCEVLYENADKDERTQASQAETVIAEGAKALVLNPLNIESSAAIVKEAKAEHVPVIDFDQLIVENSESDAFVSFSVVRVGELEAESLAGKLVEDGNAAGPIVFLNGEQGNSEQPMLAGAARKAFNAAGVRIVRNGWTQYWKPSAARGVMRQAIRKLGKNGFAAVFAETDGIASGAIEAMESAGIDPAERPVTGWDATVAGVQQILAGQQYMTVYEPVGVEASRAADVAVDLAKGKGVPRHEVTERPGYGNPKVPAILIEPVVVTKDNVKQTVIADGFISPAELCTGSYASDCEAAGISG
jgi:D-xylose transport system substrate-binding protein